MKAKINFICNNSEIEVSVHPGLSLLDFLREELHLTGSKEGCREGDCGACTVLIGEIIETEIKYLSANSCLLPIGDVNGKHVVTIEGLKKEDLTLVQESFVNEGASQCGFCTPGFIVSLTGYYLSNKNSDADTAIASMDGNVCRCTGHYSILRAARSSTELFSTRVTDSNDHLTNMIKAGLIPEYFSSIGKRLKKLKQKAISDATDSPPKFYIAGGTDLFVQRWEEILESDVNLLSSNGLSSKIKEENRSCVIGARASVTDLIDSEIIINYFPLLRKKLKLFGSVPIRNRATVGGNIVNASPIADIAIILLALDARLHLRKNNSERELPLADFYKGYKKIDLEQDELIKNISFELPEENSYFNFEKVSQRIYLDISSVNSSIFLKIEKNKIIHIRLSAGGVAPVPLCLKNCQEYLIGKEINSQIIKEAAAIALLEISPISDVRGSAKYKSLLLRQLIFSHFLTLFPQKISISEFV